MKFKSFLRLFILTTLLIATQAEDDEVDYDETNEKLKVFKRFCSFDRPLLNHTIDEDEEFCDCDVTSSVKGHNIIGMPMVKINCELSDRVNLTNEIFHAEKLPINTVSLILSFQYFTEIPDFVGKSLIELDLSNNQISTIKDLNFIHVTALESIDLSYNSISEINSNAFSLLQFLHHLDLTGNRLMVLPTNVFSPLSTLETLKLSENEGLAVLGSDISNNLLTGLYLHLGVTPRLKTLIMERCNLSRINLFHGVGLESLNLANNNITDFSKLDLPNNLHSLDLSANPVRMLTANSLSHMYNLNELKFEDMPYLGIVSEYSLYGFPRLHTLSFEGSKNLSQFDGHAFGINVVTNETDLELKVLNLRGCNLRTLNETLMMVLDHIEKFNLDGNPFYCNCEIEWIKELDIETELRCVRPDSLFGHLLSEVEENDLHCSKISMFMKKLINSVILLVLLIGCSLMIWCFFRQLNPNRNRNFQKVSPESPYQRVTIEPNRAEYALR